MRNEETSWVHVTLVRESPKAYLLLFDEAGEEHWITKSAVRGGKKRLEVDVSVRVEIQNWLLGRIGLLDDD